VASIEKCMKALELNASFMNGKSGGESEGQVAEL
jgi:hypothetical protein